MHRVDTFNVDTLQRELGPGDGGLTVQHQSQFAFRAEVLIETSKICVVRGALDKRSFASHLSQCSLHNVPFTRTSSRVLSEDFEPYRLQQWLHLTSRALHGRADRHHKIIRLCSHHGWNDICHQLFMDQQS